MKPISLIILLVFFTAGCTNTHKGIPQIVTESNSDFYVEKLFKMENCTVYRFYDGGYARYFTDCTETISSHQIPCGGKGQYCTHPDNIR